MGWVKFDVNMLAKNERATLISMLAIQLKLGARRSSSEEDEDLLDVAFDVLHLLADNVEADGLGEGSALADGNDITHADAEGGGAVGRHGLVALLESVVLPDEVQVVTTDDDRVLHLGGDNDTPKLMLALSSSTAQSLSMLVLN